MILLCMCNKLYLNKEIKRSKVSKRNEEIEKIVLFCHFTN